VQVQAQARSTSLVLRRHCRVSPQRRVIGFPVRSLVGRWFARGRTPDRLGGCCASGHRSDTRGWGFDARGGRANSRPEGNRIVRRIIARASAPSMAWCRCLPARKRGTVERAASNCVVQSGRTGWRRLLRIGAPLAWRLVTGALREASWFRPGSCLPANGVATTRHRATGRTQRLPCGGSPPKWGSSSKTRSGNTMTPPMGFVSFRRERPR
jgi:hypothetical protein